jgi:hypothetical protein
MLKPSPCGTEALRGGLLTVEYTLFEDRKSASLWRKRLAAKIKWQWNGMLNLVRSYPFLGYIIVCVVGRESHGYKRM